MTDSTQELDTNVDNYTIDELYNILHLPIGASQAHIRAAAAKQVSRFRTAGEPELARFFLEVQARLLAEGPDAMDAYLPMGRDQPTAEDEADDEFGKPEPEDDKDISDWLSRQYLDGKQPAMDGVPSRRQMTSTFGEHRTMKRQTLGVKQYFTVDVAQGENNPNLITSTTYSIVVDSKLRNAIFPYTQGNATSLTSSTAFDITLSNPLKDCISLELTSVCIPKTWYNVDATLGTNIFWINDHLGGGDIPIEIATGYYEPVQLAEELTSKAVPPLTDVCYNRLKGQFTLNFTNINPTVLDVSVIFWSRGAEYKSTTTSCSSQPVPETRVDFNLGYIMGFRYPGPVSYADVVVPIGGTQYLDAQAVADLEGTKNLYIQVEDHNQNRLSSQILPMAEVRQEIIVPNSYAPTDLSYVCLPGVQTPFYFVDQPGRGLTQAQIYSINAIAASSTNVASKDRVRGPQQANILGVLPVAAYDVPWGKNIVASGPQLMTNKRIYFGPVSLNKLNVRLLDDLGNTVNLHGRDWSFTVNAVSLYQY